MKDTRFIELINLYIDRQISAAETAELEAEIQVSPKHRKIYQQYCHMHRATKQVYESFRTNAEQPAGEIAESGGSIAQFEHSRRKSQRLRWVYSTAGMAAAACFALVLLRNNAPTNANHTTATPDHPAVVASASLPVAMPQPAAVTVVSSPEAQATAAEQKYAALLSAMRQEEIRTFAISQQKMVQPLSLFPETVFANNQTLTVEAQKLFLPKRKTDKSAATEFTAFQFQR